MIIDTLTTFADAASTGNTGTRVVGDVVDLFDLGGDSNALTASLGGQRDVGMGQPIYLMVMVAEGITAASAGTIQVQLVSADNDALSTNPEIHVQTAALVTGTTPIAAGRILLHVALPMEGPPYRRFLGIREVVVTQNTTAGALHAFLTLDPHGWRAYPQGSVD